MYPKSGLEVVADSTDVSFGLDVYCCLELMIPVHVIQLLPVGNVYE